MPRMRREPIKALGLSSSLFHSSLSLCSSLLSCHPFLCCSRRKASGETRSDSILDAFHTQYLIQFTLSTRTILFRSLNLWNKYLLWGYVVSHSQDKPHNSSIMSSCELHITCIWSERKWREKVTKRPRIPPLFHKLWTRYLLSPHDLSLSLELLIPWPTLYLPPIVPSPPKQLHSVWKALSSFDALFLLEVWLIISYSYWFIVTWNIRGIRKYKQHSFRIIPAWLYPFPTASLIFPSWLFVAKSSHPILTRGHREHPFWNPIPSWLRRFCTRNVALNLSLNEEREGISVRCLIWGVSEVSI